MESVGERGAKIPVFDGKADKYQLWWRRFKAYAKFNKFGNLLVDHIDPDLAASYAESESDTATATQKLALKRNDMAMAAFTMAFATEELMTFIDRAEDNTWPNGIVYKVVRALNLKYKTTDIMSKTEMRMAISDIKMKNNEDPTTLFTQMSSIEVKYRQTISVEEKLAIVMQHIPKAAAIRSTELSTTETSVSMEELSQTLVAHYRALQFSKNDKQEKESTEFSAFAEETRICNYCKKKGHIAKDCFKLKKKKDSDLVCTTCNKKGHTSQNCFENPANKNKVPEWYNAMCTPIGLRLQTYVSAKITCWVDHLYVE